MAIVAEYKYPHGVVRIDDDCYRGVSEEEMQERIRRLQELAWELRAKSAGQSVPYLQKLWM